MRRLGRTAAVASLLAVLLAACGGSPTSPSPPAPPPAATCAGVRGPVLAFVMGGGTALLPPEPNPTFESLARSIGGDYQGSWTVDFTVRAGRDVAALTSRATTFLDVDPTAELLLVGHSSGGADGDAIARALGRRGGRVWLITVDPVADTVAVGRPIDVRGSPLGAGRHRHILQPRPGPTIPDTAIQLGLKIDYRPGETLRTLLPGEDHGSIKQAAIPLIDEELTTRMGACRR